MILVMKNEALIDTQEEKRLWKKKSITKKIAKTRTVYETRRSGGENSTRLGFC